MSSDEDKDADAYAEWQEYRKQESEKAEKKANRIAKVKTLFSFPLEFYFSILSSGMYIYTEDMDFLLLAFITYGISKVERLLEKKEKDVRD